MHLYTSFGLWLRQVRKAHDLTQEDLARRIACSTTTLRLIEANRRRPSRQLAERLADQLHLGQEERADFVSLARGLPVASADPTVLQDIPIPLTSLIGRTTAVVEVCSMLERAGVRLLTLVGPPGIGKTRLSLQVATQLQEHFIDGVYFVELAPLSDPELIASTIAKALGVKDTGAWHLVDSLKAYLREKHLLLVLDNFEHVVRGAPLVTDLLQTVPRLKVLVTSRMPLHLYGEHQFQVLPLALPDPRCLLDLESLLQYEAVRLFVARARAVKADFALTPANTPVVAEICCRVDGLPLAIELAAAQSKLLAPEALLVRLRTGLTLLAGGARDLPERHQTLRSAIDWSYDLLPPAEQTLFARLGVFVGGFTAEAAEAVCHAGGDLLLNILDGLRSLLDQSLLQQQDGADGEQRFVMLETIREYALERLAARGEAEALRRRHATYFLAVAEASELELRGPRQQAWLARLDAEHDNLRTTLAWSQAAAGSSDHLRLEVGLRVVGALWQFWLLRGYFEEWQRWLAGMLALLDSRLNARDQSRIQNLKKAPRAWAKALSGRSMLAICEGDGVRAAVLGEESLELYRATGSRSGIAGALIILGVADGLQGDDARGRTRLEEGLALARETGDHWLTAWALLQLGDADVPQPGDLMQKMAFLEESLALARDAGDPWLIAWALHRLGRLATHRHDYQRAAVLLEEGLAIRRELQDKLGIAHSLGGLGEVAVARGEYEAAWMLHEERLAIEQELGNKHGIAHSLRVLGAVALAQGDYPQARVLYHESLALYQGLGEQRGIAGCLVGLAALNGARLPACSSLEITA